jgi:hypothetical protein
MRLQLILGAGMAVLAACSTREAPAPDVEVDTAVVREIDGIDAVRERFNADVARPRVLTILSPT